MWSVIKKGWRIQRNNDSGSEYEADETMEHISHPVVSLRVSEAGGHFDFQSLLLHSASRRFYFDAPSSLLFRRSYKRRVYLFHYFLCGIEGYFPDVAVGPSLPHVH